MAQPNTPATSNWTERSTRKEHVCHITNVPLLLRQQNIDPVFVFFTGGKFIIYLICLFCVSITLTSLAALFFIFHFNKCVANEKQQQFFLLLLFLLLLIFRLLASYLIRIVRRAHTQATFQLFHSSFQLFHFFRGCRKSTAEIWERVRERVYIMLRVCVCVFKEFSHFKHINRSKKVKVTFRIPTKWAEVLIWITDIKKALLLHVGWLQRYSSMCVLLCCVESRKRKKWRH